LLVGALVNRRAVCRRVLDWGGPAHLVCAGREGAIATEDAVGAGAIVEGLGEMCVLGNDAARLVRDVFRANADNLLAALHETIAAEQLRGLGLERDVDDTAVIDRFDLVPEFDPASGRIVAPKN
jgi:2-phosphosulfolactate phosphatase